VDSQAGLQGGALQASRARDADALREANKKSRVAGLIGMHAGEHGGAGRHAGAGMHTRAGRHAESG